MHLSIGKGKQISYLFGVFVLIDRCLHIFLVMKFYIYFFFSGVLLLLAFVLFIKNINDLSFSVCAFLTASILNFIYPFFYLKQNSKKSGS